MQERRTTMGVHHMLGAVNVLLRSETDLVRKPVNGLWGWFGNLVVRGHNELGTTRSAVLFRPEWCELHRVGVEVH